MATQSRPTPPKSTVANSNSAAIVRLHSNRTPGAAPFEINYNNKPLVDFLHPGTPSAANQWLHRLLKRTDSESKLPQPPGPGEIVRWRLKHPSHTPSSKVDNLIEFHAPNSQPGLVSRAELLALHRQHEQSNQLIQRLVRHRAIATLVSSLALGLAIGLTISNYQTSQLLKMPQSMLQTPTLATMQAAVPAQKPQPAALKAYGLDAQAPTNIPPVYAPPANIPEAAAETGNENKPQTTVATSSIPAIPHIPGKQTIAVQTPESATPDTPKATEAPASAAVTATTQPAWQHQLQIWSTAWAAGDVKRYIASYTADYQPHRVSGNNGKTSHRPSHEQWVNQRTQKLRNSKHINVQLSDIRWQIPTDLSLPIQVRFIQDYRSNSYRDRVEKVLSMRRNDAGEWRISAERTIRVLPLQ